tara:strand:- start:3535 stop:4128 length:594 start_codon:yes stop_codon:yes gene_type:complete
VGIFNFFFGSNNKVLKNEKSPYLTYKKDPKEIQFAQNFTNKGGKFIFSENKDQTLSFFNQILTENAWSTSDLKSESSNLNSFFKIDTKPNLVKNNKYITQVLSCEYLIANKGSILICSHQIKNYKLDELPENIIIFAGVSQFASDVSEAMSMINSKYKENLPTNITTLNAFNQNEEEDFLSYGSCTKNLYLIVQEDF